MDISEGGDISPLNTSFELDSSSIVDVGNIENTSQPNVKNNSQLNDKNINLISNANLKYTKDDVGPFMVYIESNMTPNNRIGKYNSLKIARDIFNLQLNDIKKINNKGTNRIAVEFVDYESANNFLANKKLKDKGYKLFIPFNFVTCKGLIRGIDLDIDTEDIVKFSSGRRCSVLSARRMNRKVTVEDRVEYKPTGTILLTFKGVVLPRYISIYGLEYNVSLYIPPVTQCFNCYLFGHTKQNCKGKAKCVNCADIKHDNAESCILKCMYCKEKHRATYTKCPEYIRQKNIKYIMAYENLTYFDANKACPKNYAPTEGYVFNPSSFPSLKKDNYHIANQTQNENIITPSQRRTADFSSNDRYKRSFKQTVSTENNKKRVIYQNYNRTSHNDNLLCPNGRSSSEPQSSIFNFGSSKLYNDHPSTSTVLKEPTIESSQIRENDLLKITKENFLQMSPSSQTVIRDFILTQSKITQYKDYDAPKQ